ncbi:phosphatidylinositol 4-phosphate 3-kinase C2 domain-containing subunit alpha [Spea bombifrons]|uniref:phosphatidylinositol 4-phosphate 3-kinase C2 domain-containing subunit alpha n=1 Tax=Spea bombifrons TaxID=233779 RepID=UPI0023496BA0|nr:phosphatidylinositol 4-phosphate 3-kinase C2 domain-containing subunit alpha [Spea bombifrons]
MAQVSSSNGLGHKLSASCAKDVDKEEALQMEAEALAKLRKEKRAVGSQDSVPSRMKRQPLASGTQDLDLMVFPESDAKKRAGKPLENIDLEKLTTAELEKLLLDENFEDIKPQKTLTIPPPQAFNPPPQYYVQPPFPRTHWGSGLQGPMSCTLPPSFSVSYHKSADPFLNGSGPNVSIMQARDPVFLAPQAQYVSYPVPASSPFHLTRSLPAFTNTVNPDLAKLLDKIARTSEFVKNGKSSHNGDLAQAETAVSPVQATKKLDDISKFDWLDLDPLSKPKVDSVELANHIPDSGMAFGEPATEDPWDAVLMEEKPVKPTYPDRKSNAKSPSGATVTRSHSLNLRAAPSQITRSHTIETDSGSGIRTPAGNAVLPELEAENEEVASFCEEVAKLRERSPRGSLLSNPGFILSPVTPQRSVGGELSSVKVSIEIEGFQQPVTFTCDVSSPVEVIIMQALCWVHDDLNQVDIESYVLKVCGQEEALQNKHCLGSHEYIQLCRKWDTEIRLQLLSVNTMCRDLARTDEDDETPVDLDKHLALLDRPFKEPITRQSIEELLDAFHEQVSLCLKNETNPHRMADQVVRAVRSICKTADGVETPAITEAVKKLRRAVNLPRNRRTDSPSKTMDGSAPSAADGPAQSETPLQESLASLTTAVHSLLLLYFRSHPAATSGRTTKEARSSTDHLQFTVFAAHGIPTGWVSSFEKYYLVCSLRHNGKDIFKPVQSKKVGTYKSFFYLVKWDELIIFPIPISQLPLESVLQLTLFGVLNPNSGGSPDSNKQRKGAEVLAQASFPLFTFKRLLTCGTKLLNLWTSFNTNPAAGTVSKKQNPMQKLVLQVDFPSPAFDIIYRAPPPASGFVPQNMDSLDADAKSRLLTLLAKDATFGLSKEERVFLWEKRYYCRERRESLPKILASAPSWDVAYLGDIYALIGDWPPLLPVNALELLNGRFSDQEVRATAVRWIDAGLSDDELVDFLPQFVQALKYEIYLDNALVRFLLSRALGSIRVAHYLYWLLKDSLNDPYFGTRYEQVLGALLSLVGKGLRGELEKQTRLAQVLGVVAEKVRQASGSSRQVALQEGMERVQLLFRNSKCRLPLNPSLVAKELNVKTCSFFSSNAVPLKVTMVNADPLGEEINSMFKVGEDLRQDMLALQMIKIMDKLWLQEGLDLRMVLFKCLSTGKDRGMVELVLSSDTLRKIQVEYGLTGSFKDKPLAEWLRKYNPSEEEYEKASENFIYSCAGCCVATYVLGICDRHNDNIMLRSTGHMFHIDFGKFLGHAQMFGSFKRDRAPFVLTSDMAYVINGGEKPTSRFQLFVDLCCQAYNLLRKHTNLFLNLLSLMLSSGLPELTGIQDLKYVIDALQPQATEAEATIFFTRLIESSLGSVATKFNFFIHNLAQRFSGLPSNEEAILSFTPKTFSLKQDGRIREASVFTYHKRYNPDKYYIYVVRVIREGQDDSAFIFRTFDEFQELHNKLSLLFPLWKLPGFPGRVVLGRTHIKDVAARRKVELNSYIQSLLRGSPDVSECDLVYTFFHPLPRDEKADGADVRAVEGPPLSPASGKIEGEMKLSISYRNGTLFIMVMHIKDLVTEDTTDPNPYVKTYLLPDPHKTSKRKTKISRKTCNPTFNEMLVYSGYSKETLRQRELQLSVLSAESLRENFFLGGVTLPLKDFNLNQETVGWHKLTEVPYFS